MDSILSDQNEKERADHRHHAIDAIVIAVADQRSIQRLSEAAERMEREGRERPFDSVDPPWDGFVEDSRNAIEAVNVSYRQFRKICNGKKGGQGVRGPLHKDTLYSKDHRGKRRMSKEIWKLKPNEIEAVVDKYAMASIQMKLRDLGESNPEKAFQAPENRPLVRGHDGRMVPLRRARIEARAKPKPFGKGATLRYAVNEANHHMAFYDRRIPGGAIERIAKVVSLSAAADRLASADGAGGALVDRSEWKEHLFVFSLALGEFVMLATEGQAERLCRVTSISDNDLKLVVHTDGRPKADRGKTITQEGLRLAKSAIAKANFRKVHVNYLGELFDAGG
jgi:CRISPR-associated endonuclease Csn1